MSARSKKSHPQSTAAISHAHVHDATTVSTIAHFSPDASLFALLTLAIDKHRIRIFDASTGSPIVEHTLDARATTAQWLTLGLAVEGAHGTTAIPMKKRKKAVAAAAEELQSPRHPLLCVGLSNGTIVLFSAKQSRIFRTLSHPSCLSPIRAVSTSSRPSQIWSSCDDGTLRLWNAVTNELLGSWKAEGIPYSALAPRPGQEDGDENEILVANHTMRLLSVRTSKSVIETEKPAERASFTGHASNVLHLEWDASHPSRFISTAAEDRVVNLWRMPSPPSTQGSMTANIPLDSVARQASISSSASKSTLLTVSASGKVSLFELPSDTKSKVATLTPQTTITTPSKKGGEDVTVVAACFLEQPGRVRVARLKGGLKPIFDDVQYLDDSGSFVSQASLTKDVSLALAAAAEGVKGAQQRRYVETPYLAVGSGVELGQEIDEIPTTTDADLDVDLAELSLGQRLTALSGGDNAMEVDEDGSSDSGAQKGSERRRKSRSGKDKEPNQLSIPTNSLARTLVQALHSADTRLLETCLLHTDERVVMNTVRRLPPQLAVPLLNACVERLGRGARASTGKGRGGGASAQRGMGLVKWVRAVLVVHTAHLMTIPDLVTRLSSLHATINARLALRDPLLALSGRLDMVLSQVELRASGGPKPIVAGGKRAQKAKREPSKYVEGETSESSGDEMEVEADDDAGSVEDVELGGNSGSDEGDDDDEGVQEDDEEDEDDEDDEDEDDSDEDGPHLNGYVDDEAEEEWGSDSEKYSDE